jgi:hypothetical protein
MARGWGKNEEDLGADKEHAREAADAPGSGSREDARRRTQAHSLRLSLARIEDQLVRSTNPVRRQALEIARREVQERLTALGVMAGGDGS